MSAQDFTVGSKVRLVASPPYLKTAEPMPMLRPPDRVLVGEEGVVMERRPGGYWCVRLIGESFCWRASI